MTHDDGRSRMWMAFDELIKARPGLMPRTAVLRRAPKGGIRPDTGKAYRGGQFIPEAVWEAQKRQAAGAFDGRIEDFGADLQLLRGAYEQSVWIGAQNNPKAPQLPLSTIEARMKATIRRAYQDAFILGKRETGNLTDPTPEEKNILKALRYDEFRYLRGFLADMRSGSGRMAYERRMEMYQAALREARWVGWVLGDRRPGVRKISWRTGPTEHCPDCLRYEKHGEYDVDEFIRDVLSKHHVPQSGALACLGFHCACMLTDRLVGIRPKSSPPANRTTAPVSDSPPVQPPTPPAMEPVPDPVEPTQAPVPVPAPVAAPEPPAGVPGTVFTVRLGDGVEEAPAGTPVHVEAPIQHLPVNPQPVMPGVRVSSQPIRILGLPPATWLKLDKAKVKTVGQLVRRGMTGGDLAAFGLKPAEQDAVRRALRIVGAAS